MELVGKIVLICFLIALLGAFALVVKLTLCSRTDSEGTENETQEKKPKLEPPTEGDYYTAKLDRMLTDAELQQMGYDGWGLVTILPETYHKYLGTFPEAPCVECTRYIYVFKRYKSEQ